MRRTSLQLALASNPSTPLEAIRVLLERAGRGRSGATWWTSVLGAQVLANPSRAAAMAFLRCYEDDQGWIRSILVEAVRTAPVLDPRAAAMLVSSEDPRLLGALSANAATAPELLRHIAATQSWSCGKALSTNPSLPRDVLLTLPRGKVSSSTVVTTLGDRAEEFLLSRARTMGEFLGEAAPSGQGGRGPDWAPQTAQTHGQARALRARLDVSAGVARALTVGPCGSRGGDGDVGRAAQRAREELTRRVEALRALEDAAAATQDRAARRRLRASVARVVREVEDGIAAHERLVAALGELRAEEGRAVDLEEMTVALEERARATRELSGLDGTVSAWDATSSGADAAVGSSAARAVPLD